MSASPTAHLVGTDVQANRRRASGQGHPAHPGPHIRGCAARGRAQRGAARRCAPAQEGLQGAARRVRPAGPRPARGPHLRLADQARGQALPAPPRADRRRHRRAGDLARAQALPRALEPGRPRDGPAAAARARRRRRRHIRPRDRRGSQALPARQGPHRRRDRRPRDLVRARPQRDHEGAQAPRARPAPLRAPGRRQPRDQGRHTDRAQAVQVRRRPRQLRRLRLRLLRLGLLRAPRRRAPGRAQGLERVHVMGRAGQGPLHHDLRQPRARVHGRPRPPLRHHRRRRPRRALAMGAALVSGLHRAASSWSLTSIAQAQALFSAEGTYLNTASYGLPPEPAWDALQRALEDWRHGRTSWEGWGEDTDRARAVFARLVKTRPEHVAIGWRVSGLVGLVAASLPAGTRVVVPDIEFTSTLFPFMVQPELEVITVAPAQLAETIDETVGAVAFSAVQMSTGEVADLDAILAAAEAHDVLTLVDATQATGWLPLDATRFDFLVAAGYKWLLSPRGTAWMAVAPERLESILPAQAGWFAGEDVHKAYIGPPLRLASDTRRLDTSPAWFSWVGALPALELLEAVGVEAIHEHDVGLANRCRAAMGMKPGNSAIVTLPGDADVLRNAGIQAAQRGDLVRVGFHLYNDEEDADRVADVLSKPS